jgi:hypothetical protein
MRIEQVEIFSDFPNIPVMRHPGRKFPGVLIQGDALYTWCQSLDHICESARHRVSDEAYTELNELRNRLWSSLNSYKQVLAEHEIRLPFSEQPR